MNWNAVGRGITLFLLGQFFIVVGAVLIALEPIAGIVCVLVGVVVHTKLLLGILTGGDSNRGGKPA